MEESRLGFTYPQAGAELANRWKFPVDIVDGIRHQLQPEVEGNDYKQLAGIILIAKYLHEYRDRSHEELVTNIPTKHIEKLSLDKVAIIDNLEDIAELDKGIEELIG